MANGVRREQTSAAFKLRRDFNVALGAAFEQALEVMRAREDVPRATQGPP
jgi:hypothetical protein